MAEGNVPILPLICLCHITVLIQEIQTCSSSSPISYRSWFWFRLAFRTWSRVQTDTFTIGAGLEEVLVPERRVGASQLMFLRAKRPSVGEEGRETPTLTGRERVGVRLQVSILGGD